MIISVKDNDLSAVYAFCENNLLGAKISCQLKAYGTERDFLSAWYCLNKDKITAVISKFEDSITLVTKDVTDLSEIRTFIDMLGFSSLCCSEYIAESLDYDISYTKNAYIFGGNTVSVNTDDLSEEYYKSAYGLISRSIPDSFADNNEAYLSFLSDFTFRKRRGLARIKGTAVGGKVASCALTSAETDSAAIISGVACDSELRQKGLGKSTVLSLVGELISENKKVYVIALNESAEGFYEHIGFTNTEKIAFIERK